MGKQKKEFKNKILTHVLCLALVAGLCWMGYPNNTMTVHAAAAYEPMVVSSGYNYDIIATTGEDPTKTESIDAACGTKAGSSYACFYTTALYSTGGFPTNGVISSEASGTSGLTWQLGTYTSKNALKLNPGNASGTLAFSKIGCYQKVYILSVAGGLGSGNSAVMQATINYTDGSSSSSTFSVRDWWDNVNAATNNYRRYCKGYTNNDNCGSTTGAPYLTQSVMTVDTTKLIKSISFKNTAASGSGMYLSILGVTGLTANVDVPVLQAATGIRTNKFTVNWNLVSNAASYRIDVATDSGFSNILSNYNNRTVNTNSLEITGLGRDTTYYYRVRAVDSTGGQSASSSVKSTTTHKCDVFYLDNGGTGGPEITDLTSDWKLPASVSAPVRDGYEFDGYFGAMVNGTKYYDSQGNRVYNEVIPEPVTSMNLYAQWKIHYSNLYVNPNGGTYNGESNIVLIGNNKFGASVRIEDPEPLDGVTAFSGWVTDNGNGTLVRGAGYTTFIYGPDTTDVTLKAIWDVSDKVLPIENTTGEEITVSGLTSLFDVGNTVNAEEGNKGITNEEFAADNTTVKAVVHRTSEASEITDLVADSSSVVLRYYDISVIKSTNGVETSLKELPETITLDIELVGGLEDKTGYSVYRVHDGVAEEMSSSVTAREYYEVIYEDGAAKKIRIHTRKFSTYAVTASSAVIGPTEELTEENNWAATDVKGKYVDGSGNAIYKIDVEWGSMKFDFHKHQKWDPETHTYSTDVMIELDEAAYQNGNNEIVITNHSNADVRVDAVVSEKDFDGINMRITNTNEETGQEVSAPIELSRVAYDGDPTADQRKMYVRMDYAMLNGEALEELLQNPTEYTKVGVITLNVTALDSEMTPINIVP